MTVEHPPWWKRAGAWIGIGTGPGVLMVGAQLALRLSGVPLLLAAVLGAALLTGLSVAHGALGRRERRSTAPRVVAILGPWGGMVLNTVLAIGMTGWLGFYVGTGAAGLVNLTGLPLPLAAALIGALLLLLASAGTTRWNLFVWITAAAALGSALTALLAAGGGPPAAPVAPADWTAVIWGIGVVLAYAMVFASRTPDFTWDLRSERDLLGVGSLMFATLLAFLAVGALLYRMTGGWNLGDILATGKATAIGNFFLIVSMVAPALSVLYSGSMAFAHTTRVSPARLRVALVVVAILLGGSRFDRQMVPFLGAVGAIIAPSVMVLLLSDPRRSRRGLAFAAWLAGAAAGTALALAGSEVGVAAGALVSAIPLVLGGGRIRHRARTPSPERAEA